MQMVSQGDHIPRVGWIAHEDEDICIEQFISRVVLEPEVSPEVARAIWQRHLTQNSPEMPPDFPIAPDFVECLIKK